MAYYVSSAPGYKYGPLLESDDDDLEAIVDTNILGVMLCCKEVRVT
jgi:chlorophyll(ide) b reductase